MGEWAGLTGPPLKSKMDTPYSVPTWSTNCHTITPLNYIMIPNNSATVAVANPFKNPKLTGPQILALLAPVPGEPVFKVGVNPKIWRAGGTEKPKSNKENPAECDIARSGNKWSLVETSPTPLAQYIEAGRTWTGAIINSERLKTGKDAGYLTQVAALDFDKGIPDGPFDAQSLVSYESFSSTDELKKGRKVWLLPEPVNAERHKMILSSLSKAYGYCNDPATSNINRMWFGTKHPVEVNPSAVLDVERLLAEYPGPDKQETRKQKSKEALVEKLEGKKGTEAKRARVWRFYFLG